MARESEALQQLQTQRQKVQEALEELDQQKGSLEEQLAHIRQETSQESQLVGLAEGFCHLLENQLVTKDYYKHLLLLAYTCYEHILIIYCNQR